MTDTSDALVQPAPPEIDEETAAVLARDLWGVRGAARALGSHQDRNFLITPADAAPRVLLADSRVRDLGDDAYRLRTMVEARTWPDLNEFEEFNRVRVYVAGQCGEA